MDQKEFYRRAGDCIIELAEKRDESYLVLADHLEDLWNIYQSRDLTACQEIFGGDLSPENFMKGIGLCALLDCDPNGNRLKRMVA